MGLFRRDLPPAAEERSTVNLGAYAASWADFIGATGAVNAAKAMTHAASSACVDTLASSVSSLPLDAVRMDGEVRIPVTPSPRLISRPSDLVETDVWKYQLMHSALTDGNVFGEIMAYGAGGLPTSIELIDPANVTERSVVNGVPTVRISGTLRQLYPFGDVWHMPGPLVEPGSPFGKSPVARASETIGAAIAARDFGSQFYADGGHPGAIIQSDQVLSDEQARGIKAAFQKATKGNREAAVFGSGLTYTPIMEVNDQTYIELMRFCNEEAARFWRVPPSMIYAATSGQAVTYSNVTQDDLSYLKHSLERHLVRVETALTRILPRPQFARFNRSAFLRSDPVTRSEVVDRRLKNKTMTVNEAKALEDERPYPDPEFDKPGIPGADMAPPPAAADPGATGAQ